MDLSGLLAEDELTELVDADIPRVDLVDKGANGITRFLIAKQDAESAGLLDPEFVRDLIAKAEPEPEREREVLPNGITVSGSPADIAAFIHKAALRAEAGDVAKEKNDTADRKHKAATGAAMPDGSYPIADRSDLGKAIRAVGRGGSSHDAIRRHIISRARSLGASSEIPDNWNSDGSLKGDVSKEAAVADPVSKAVTGETDGGIDGLDPTVVLAEPDMDAPGSDAEPGSPAWEAVDAATACKWTSILARARVAVEVLAEREMLEAASADPDDAENACDLQDVCCAIDYAISVLAPFAVAEQSEADCGAGAMEAIGKAAGTSPAELAAVAKAAATPDLADALAKIEGLAWIRKAGRVLSSVNEAHIREAAQRLNTVLSSLPQAPQTDDGQPVAKMTPAQEADMPESVTSAEVTAASGQEPAMGAGEPEAVAKAAAGILRPPAQVPGEVTLTPGGLPEAQAVVAKADSGEGKAPMMVVYNQAGKLVGIVDPHDITPVANAEADPEDDMDPDGDGTEAAAPATDATDMTPAPAAEAGTPSGGVTTDGNVTKQDGTITVTQDVLKSTLAEALAQLLAAQAPAEDVAKQADVAGLSEEVATLKARLAQVEEQPAAPKVFTNGAVPPAHQMRGQDQGAPQPVDVAKAMERRREFYSADPADQTRIANEMQASAIDQLAAIHRRGPA